MSKNRSRRGAEEQGFSQEAEENFGRPGHDQLVKGLSHPVRIECLTILTKRVASPRQLSELLEHDLSNISYHVRTLVELGLVELVGEESVRGAVAHFYKAVERPLLANAEWIQLPASVRQMISVYSWDILLKDATESIEKGAFDSRSDRHLTRTTLLLDSEGFNRLSKLMDGLLEEVLSEQAAAAERMSKSGQKAIHAVAATALFPMPDPE